MLIRKKHLVLLLGALIASGSAFAADDPTRYPVLKTASRYPVQYYLSLPKTWSADKKWPVLLAIDASYGDFIAQIDRFVKARKDSPFIIVVPYLTMGRTIAPDERKAKFHYSPEVWRRIEKEGAQVFDLAAIDAVLAEVRTQYGGEDKPFLTGWGQGGGNMTWSLIFTQPERWRAVAASCPHFQSQDAAKVSGNPERVNLSIKVFQGESDFLRSAANLDAEWDRAKEVADKHGYKNLSRVLIPDKYHDPFADQVMDFFRTILKP